LSQWQVLISSSAKLILHISIIMYQSIKVSNWS
jgi:hypothetical protein